MKSSPQLSYRKNCICCVLFFISPPAIALAWQHLGLGQTDVPFCLGILEPSDLFWSNCVTFHLRDHTSCMTHGIDEHCQHSFFNCMQYYWLNGVTMILDVIKILEGANHEKFCRK